MEISRSIQETAPGRLEIKKGGGCLTLFGVPFLAAGVFVTLMGFKIIPLENAAEVPAWGWPLMILMGLVFVAAGGAMVFGRGTTIIEAGRGIIIEQSGLLVPMRSRESSISEFSAVVIEYLPGDSDSPDRYPVKLQTAGQAKDLALHSPTEYADALRQARLIAKTLRFPLKDRTSDHEVMFAPEELEMSFRERIHRRPPEDQSYNRPPAMRSEIEESGGAVQITIPQQVGGPARLLRLGFPALVLLFMFLAFSGLFHGTRTPEAVQWMFFGVAGLVFIVSLLSNFTSLVFGQRRRTVVSVNKEGMVIEGKGGWRTRSTTIPVDMILDLDYGTKGSAEEVAHRVVEGQRRRGEGGMNSRTSRLLDVLRLLVRSKGMTVKATSGVYAFGSGLPDEEIQYIYSVVRRVLAG
jgi:hypothetical protein